LGTEDIKQFVWEKYVARTAVLIVDICKLGNRLSGFGFHRGIEYVYLSCWELFKKYFIKVTRPALGPTQPPIQGYRVSFTGVKRSQRGVDHPPSSSAGIKERVELYLYSPSGPSWPVLERTLIMPDFIFSYFSGDEFIYKPLNQLYFP
jgi:hypothetical protein